MTNPEDRLLLAILARHIKDYIVYQLYANQIITLKGRNRRREAICNVYGAKEFIFSDNGGVLGFDFICTYFGCDPDYVREKIQAVPLERWKQLYHSQAWRANPSIGKTKEGLCGIL